MPREICPVTAAILNFKMAAFSHIQPLQLVIGLQCLLSLKVLKPPNSINENFKISNYENKLIIFKDGGYFQNGRH